MITGGCGLIGANLVSYILNRTSAKITVLDNLSKGNKVSIEGLDAELIVGDVRNKDVVDQVTEGKDTVIHLAAQTGVIDSIEDPFKDACVNIEGSLNLLQASVKHGVKRFVFASSAAPLVNRPHRCMRVWFQGPSPLTGQANCLLRHTVQLFTVHLI